MFGLFDGLPESGTVYKRLAEKRSTGRGGRRRGFETPYFSLQRPVTTGLLTKAHLLTPRIDDYDIRRLEMFDVSSGDTGMPRTRYPTNHGVADFNGLASLTLISEK